MKCFRFLIKLPLSASFRNKIILPTKIPLFIRWTPTNVFKMKLETQKITDGP